MIPCWGRVLWIAFATALIRWSSRASLIANGPLRDRRRRKPAGSRQPELWGTFRKCGYGHRNEIFFGYSGFVVGNTGPPTNREAWSHSFARNSLRAVLAVKGSLRRKKRALARDGQPRRH